MPQILVWQRGACLALVLWAARLSSASEAPQCEEEAAVHLQQVHSACEEEAVVQLQQAHSAPSDKLETNASGVGRPVQGSGTEFAAAGGAAAVAGGQHGRAPVVQDKQVESTNSSTDSSKSGTRIEAGEKTATQDTLAESTNSFTDSSNTGTRIKAGEETAAQAKLAESTNTSTDSFKSGRRLKAGEETAQGGASVKVTLQGRGHSGSLEHRHQQLPAVDSQEALAAGLDTLRQRHAQSLQTGLGNSLLVQALQKAAGLATVTLLVVALLLRAISRLPALATLPTRSSLPGKLPKASEVQEPLDHLTHRGNTSREWTTFSTDR